MIQEYLDKALVILDKYSLTLSEDERIELVKLLDEVSHVDPPKILAIAQTIKYIGKFNELVRENVEEINLGSRYETITELFNSVRDDSKKLVAQLDDGKIDLSEKVGNLWMKVTRGTPHSRFEKISEVYKEVCEDTHTQLENERDIISAYIDFRFALKEAEILAHEVLEVQLEKLQLAKENFQAATNSLEEYSGDDSSDKSTLQLKRDEAQEVLREEDRNYQLLKDIADNLKVSYNVGETLIIKLKQTNQVKDQIYRKAVAFFTTNEHVFTVMDAVYTSQHGLHEATQATEALKDGMNKGLEDIAELGVELERAALEAGYGSTVNPQSVQKLVDAIVTYQVESQELISKLRKQATEDSKEIEQIVEDGKLRYKQAVNKYSV